MAEAAGDTDFISLYTGYSWAEDTNYYFGGFWAALNGDWSRPGLVFSGYGAWGDYEYPNSAVSGGIVNGELAQLSALLGYQFFLGRVAFSALGGVDWQDTKLTPNDPFNPVSGSETDFVATANMKTPLGERLDLKLSGGYSVVYESYWAKANSVIKLASLAELLLVLREHFLAMKIKTPSALVPS